jgi:hypothetical protein
MLQWLREAMLTVVLDVEDMLGHIVWHDGTHRLGAGCEPAVLRCRWQVRKVVRRGSDTGDLQNGKKVCDVWGVVRRAQRLLIGQNQRKADVARPTSQGFFKPRRSTTPFRDETALSAMFSTVCYAQRAP